MVWISTQDKLPKEGKYVLARHTRGTWHDSTDQENVNCVVVKLVKGISLEERELMKADGDENFKFYKSADVFGNNLVPYNWETFGPNSFFGQEISHWAEIPNRPD